LSWPLYQVDAFTAEPFTGTRPPGRVPAGQVIRFDTASGPLPAHPGAEGP
jgi:hypothetical protein